MENISDKVNTTRKKYREIFLHCAKEIELQIQKIQLETGTDNSQAVLKFLKEDTPKDIYKKWTKILAYRENFSCTGCATCCKLACSEFSPEQLKEKSKKGDKFATQFTSVFIPYKTKEEAREIYPEYIDMLEEKLGEDEEVYFYHCPKLTAQNRCSDYENRPQICRDFPDNPLSMLPTACGYCQWKEEVEPTALMLHSMIEIIDFYKSKLSE